MSELIGKILIGIGVAFDLFGCLGLVRLPDVYNRLQAATKCVTLGTCFVLLGSGIAMGSAHAVVTSLLCAAFVLCTSPVGAHALARGAHLGGVKLWDGSVTDEYEEDKEDIQGRCDEAAGEESVGEAGAETN